MYPHLNDDQINEEVEKIFLQADLDGNGELDYSEWAVATMDK
jgi:Ca2+-binding EF-hand superfamily protein